MATLKQPLSEQDRKRLAGLNKRLLELMPSAATGAAAPA